MKTKIMTALLAGSLGFNIAVLATFGHHWIMKKRLERRPQEISWHRHRIKKMLKLTDEQAQAMEQGRMELQKTIEPIRKELQTKREVLFTLLNADNVDKAKVDALVTDISALQLKIEKTVIEHSIALRNNLTPEQRQKFKACFQKGPKKMLRRGPGFMHDAPPPF